MTIITRRQALTRLGATSAAVTLGGGATIHAAEAATSAQAENPNLIRLQGILADMLADRDALKAKIRHIADEWQDRWPLAPEELLGGVIFEGTSMEGRAAVERNIAGDVIYRDVSLFTKRFTKSWRAGAAGKQIAIMVETSRRLTGFLEGVRSQTPRGRTEKALARHRRDINRCIAELEKQLVLAHQYEEETAHLREVSGMRATKEMLTASRVRIADVRDAISHAEAFTDEGRRIKARTLRDELAESPLGLDPNRFGETALGRVIRFAIQMTDA